MDCCISIYSHLDVSNVSKVVVQADLTGVFCQPFHASCSLFSTVCGSQIRFNLAQKVSNYLRELALSIDGEKSVLSNFNEDVDEEK